MIRFRGNVVFGSSAKLARGEMVPPGEGRILELNPQRRQKILEVTGWLIVEPGTLNLDVDDAIPTKLLACTPAFVERAATIRYPAGFEHVPSLRVEYYYYHGVARAGRRPEPILARRAKVPPYPGLVELFAAVNLTKRFGLKSGDSLLVEID